MENFEKEKGNLNKLTDSEVKIVYLPAATVASIHSIGNYPEIKSGNLLHQFIKKNKLYQVKPDFRHYGFNNPNGNLPDGSDHGYERWITIPDDLEIDLPYVKKHFKGGLYCAHTIYMGDFDKWIKLLEWIQNSSQYELDFKTEAADTECLEEHLDSINKYFCLPDDSTIQINLLLPIKEKAK